MPGSAPPRPSTPVPSGTTGLAFGVNANGLVAGIVLAGFTSAMPAAGTASNGTSWQHAALPLPAGETSGEARDVNAAGTIIGGSSRLRRCDQGLVWAGPSSTPTPLPDLATGTCSSPFAINDAGHITGYAEDARGRGQAVLWLRQSSGDYTVTGLGKLKGTASSSGRGLNEPRTGTQGTTIVEVVGQSSGSAGSTQEATLWRVTVP